MRTCSAGAMSWGAGLPSVPQCAGVRLPTRPTPALFGTVVLLFRSRFLPCGLRCCRSRRGSLQPAFYARAMVVSRCPSRGAFSTHPADFRGRGGQSKKSPTVGNVPQARDPASGGDFASRRRAAAYVLHAYTVAALHGTVAARSVARPRCRMGLQLSSGLGIRCAERTFAYPPYSQPTSSPGVASRATLSVLRACAMTVTARADPDRYLRKYIIGALGLPTKHCHWKPYFLITHTAFSALA